MISVVRLRNLPAVQVLAAAVLLAGAAPVAAAADPVSSNAVAILIRDLGDARYEIRKDAADGLRRLGYAAVPALEAAARSDDPEVAMSARNLLADARLGITPDWPAALAARVRQFETLVPEDRISTLREVLTALPDDALPFLLARLRTGDQREAGAIHEHVKTAGTVQLARRITETIAPPLNPGEQCILAWAWLRLERPKDALAALSEDSDGNMRREIVEAAVKSLQQALARRKFEALLQDAADYACAATNEARFLYLDALALDALDRTQDADQRVRQALSLNPKDEAPHYAAADMLENLDHHNLAVGEWERILAIPPDNDVYDINAHLRLGRILSGRKHYAKAAAHCRKALNSFRQRKSAGGAGYGIVGASEADLEDMIRELDEAARAQKATAE